MNEAISSDVTYFAKCLSKEIVRKLHEYEERVVLGKVKIGQIAGLTSLFKSRVVHEVINTESVQKLGSTVANKICGTTKKTPEQSLAKAENIHESFSHLKEYAINKITIELACNLFQCYEHQFINVCNDDGSDHLKGLEKLAKDAVDRLMNFVNQHPDEKVTTELLTKGVVLGESKQHFRSIDFRKSGYAVILNEKRLQTTRLFDMPGRVVLANDDVRVKYYTKGNNDVCGFRRLFPWEHLDDSFKEVTGPTAEYKYTLTSESLNNRISVLLDEIVKKYEWYFDVYDPIKLFTGRSVMLAELHEALQECRQVSVCGLGGVGKTELVRKYIQTFGKEYDGRIVWINAESFNDSLRRFHKLNTDRQDDDVRTIIECVEKEFSSGKSLFVFDNAGERQNTINSDIDYCLRKLRKSNSDIFVLVTSRNRKWGDVRVMDLNSLTEEEAEELIRKGLNIKYELQETEIRDLADKLQYFPLALQQAVSYIKHANDACLNVGQEYSINDYLEDFDRQPRILLDHKLPEEGDDKYNKTVFTTWDITIDKISAHAQYGKQAKEILDIIAYFASDNIPTKMFLSPELSKDQIQELGHSVELLKKYSMISKGQDRIYFNVSPLVQTVTRLKLKENEEELGIYKKIEEMYPNLCLNKAAITHRDVIHSFLPHLNHLQFIQGRI